ncbi:hypothetical protein [Winogradskyella sp. UBA3174]|uniref:hypothetical protein n=1 Tax=Winogradskyella sp. UBA3174 TaxID=1947785 RepID=UPI0025E971D3|nr:hypothetical protein [Winogradskyella sp. UBA3174]|tara:strand:- start:24022 stop:24192 length:171 start_codon:yes stop_codon:yes gene_type:complete
MKTLKITLMLVAVLLLTVSGVKPNDFDKQGQEINKQPTKTDLIAHGKIKLKIPRQG